jgi:hypothetical protein
MLAKGYAASRNSLSRVIIIDMFVLHAEWTNHMDPWAVTHGPMIYPIHKVLFDAPARP